MYLRSLLFAPANHERHASKALGGAADAAILDLEDAVAVAEKPAARVAARASIEHRAKGHAFAFVRVNGLRTPYAYDDLQSVVVAGLDGIVVPKVESAADVCTVDWLLAQLERERGLPLGGVTVIPIIETVAGLAHVGEIAGASPRVRQLAFGAVDFVLDAGMTWTPGHEGLIWARVRIALASREAGLQPPLDTVFPDLTDRAGLVEETRLAKRLGFQGKLCIHPEQVDVVNDLFTPAPAEVERARRVVAAFDDALAGGSASLQLDGQFIDYPVAAKARQVVQLADWLAATQDAQ